MRHVKFWQPIPSPHVAGVIRSLAEIDGYSVTAIFAEGITADRVDLGWEQGQFGKARVLINPDLNILEREIEDSKNNSVINVFSAANYNPFVSTCYKRLIAADCTYGIWSEGKDRRGMRGFLRMIDSKIRDFRGLRNADFILAIGRVGREWYGINKNLRSKIHDFCYVVDEAANEQNAKEIAHLLPERVQTGNPLHIIYVGRFLDWKAPVHLIEVMAQEKNPDWILTMIGDGPERKNLENKISHFGLNEQVKLLGVLPNRQTRELVRRADVMAFPSIGDGWGAVVNEALACGTPVICTDYIGSSDLIHHRFNGSLYPCGDLDALAKELKFWHLELEQNSHIREQIKQWEICIRPPAVARHLSAILEHIYDKSGDRPIAPWRNTAHLESDN